MTPEQLEEIPGLGDELESIQAAVNNYYGQFEQSGAELRGGPGGSPADEGVRPPNQRQRCRARGTVRQLQATLIP